MNGEIGESGHPVFRTCFDISLDMGQTWTTEADPIGISNHEKNPADLNKTLVKMICPLSVVRL